MVILGTYVFSGLTNVYAETTPKIDFIITVRNIEHEDILVGVTIDGLSQNFTIEGNPKYVSAPTAQIVKFSFPRENNEQNQTPITLKLADEYIPCISFENSEASCLSGKIDSLTVPQAKNLDVKYIPS